MQDNENPLEGDVQPSTPSEGGTTPTPQGDGGRTAEDRIKELLSKNKEIMDRLEARDQKVVELEERLNTIPTPTPPAPTPQTPDAQKAIDFLKKEGKFVDTQELENRLRGVQDRMYLDSEHTRLEGVLNGQDGRPKYDRSKVEDRMRKYGGLPEDNYNLLYRTELLDWEIKKYDSDRKKKPYAARPGSSAGQQTDEQTITREKISEVRNNPTPQNRAWYEKNREKILKLMAEQKL